MLRRVEPKASKVMSQSCTVAEVGSSQTLDAATAKINGRYPESGFALNHESNMLVRVMAGVGTISTKELNERVSAGDVLFIDKQTPYFYDGSFEVLMVCSPVWSPDQYEHIDD